MEQEIDFAYLTKRMKEKCFHKKFDSIKEENRNDEIFSLSIKESKRSYRNSLENYHNKLSDLSYDERWSSQVDNGALKNVLDKFQDKYIWIDSSIEENDIDRIDKWLGKIEMLEEKARYTMLDIAMQTGAKIPEREEIKELKLKYISDCEDSTKNIKNSGKITKRLDGPVNEEKLGKVISVDIDKYDDEYIRHNLCNAETIAMGALS